jgi:hypothetical protein
LFKVPDNGLVRVEGLASERGDAEGECYRSRACGIGFGELDHPRSGLRPFSGEKAYGFFAVARANSGSQFDEAIYTIKPGSMSRREPG